MIRYLRQAMSQFKLVKDADSWDRCDEPGRMLPLLAQFLGSRKPRLLACAYIRYAPFERDGRPIWDLVPGYDWFDLPRGFQNRFMTEPRDLTIDGQALTCHSVIEMAESRADGRIDDESWKTAAFAASRAEWAAEADTFLPDREEYVGSRLRYAAAHLILHAMQDDWDTDADRLLKYLLLWPVHVIRDEPGSLHPGNGAALSDLIRDLYGNPFCPVEFKPDWIKEPAQELARSIYEERNFTPMPILGDALEESGCSNKEVLQHCRQSGPHARGCWVVDQVLGRERWPRFQPNRVVPWLKWLPEQWPRRPT